VEQPARRHGMVASLGGGEGNDNSETVRCGGGGGGGAIAMVAARIIVSGSILADGGKPGCYLGGSGYSYIPCAGGGAGGGIWLRASEVDVSGTVRADAGLQRTHCTSTPDDGVARIDAHKLSDPDPDLHLAGVLDGIPPAEHLYQSALGVVTFTNNGIATVNVDLRASD
jgi:hypothetical protein